MRRLKFKFEPLNIVAIYGQEGKNTTAHVFEIEKQNSNKFIICHIPNNIGIEDWLNSCGLKVVNTSGIKRGQYIHNRIPNPELTIKDYENIIKGIKSTGFKIDSNTYVMYTVNLEYGVIEYELIKATSISEARHMAKNFLRQYTGEDINIKNLMLDPVRNSRVTYTTNLDNSGVGVCSPGYNKYFTHKRILVGIFKANLDISKCKQNYDWLNLCR